MSNMNWRTAFYMVGWKNLSEISLTRVKDEDGIQKDLIYLRGVFTLDFCIKMKPAYSLAV